MSEELLNTDRKGASILYMVIWFSITTLILGSIIVQFIGIQTLLQKADVTQQTVSNMEIDNITRNIPYEPLIYTLIVYMLGLFGIEGTRAVVKSFDMLGLKKEAQCIPRYKHKRLIIMLITFFVLAILSMIFQIISESSANYHLDTIFYGILAGSSLIAYNDVAPKLSNELSQNVSVSNEIKEEIARERGFTKEE